MTQNTEHIAPRTSKWKVVSNALDVLGTPAQKLLALVAVGSLILGIVSVLLANAFPQTYAGLVNWTKGLIAPKEPSSTTTLTRPHNKQVKCERNLTRMIEALEAHRERERVSGPSWTHQQLFHDSLMGTPYCLVAKVYALGTDKRDGYYRTSFSSSLRHNGELFEVVVRVNTREPPPETIPHGDNAVIKGILNDLARGDFRRFELIITDATISDRWAEALQETSKAD